MKHGLTTDCRLTLGLAAAAILALLPGCGGTDAPQTSATPESEPPKAAAPVVEAQSPSANQIPIRLASWKEVEQFIAGQKGKVVILDVWSTWCVPCLREFPGLVELQKKYGEEIVCISLNCNFTGASGETPEDARGEIEKFLREKGANFENLISATPDEELYEIFQAAAVPIVRVYDKSGKLRKQFVNDDNEYGDEGFGYQEHIEPLVEDLLRE